MLRAQHGDAHVALYLPTWNAMQTLLAQGFSPCDALKFQTFGLFAVDAEVTVELLAAAWHMDASEDGRARCEAVIGALEAASLAKRGRDGRIVLHDLALDLARVGPP